MQDHHSMSNLSAKKKLLVDKRRRRGEEMKVLHVLSCK
jgi:hypothetical protein